MRIFVASLALAVSTVTLGAAPATAQDYQASRILTSFDEKSLTAVIEELGGTIETRYDGRYSITFTNGIKAVAELTACGSGSCLGTNIIANFGTASRMSEAETREFVFNYNSKRRAIKVYNRAGGKSATQEYIIADEGITMGNYRRQISLFAYMSNQYREALFNGDD